MATKYNKLIRDKILAGLDKKGIPYKSHIADDKEYNEKLFLKILEESAEVATEETDDKIKEEIADLLEVIEALKKFKNFSDKDIEEIRLKKLEEKGGFEKRIILDES